MILHSYGGDATNGAIPGGDLLLLNNAVYGTTYTGGSAIGDGTVFRLSVPVLRITSIIRDSGSNVHLAGSGAPLGSITIQGSDSLDANSFVPLATVAVDETGIGRLMICPRRGRTEDSIAESTLKPSERRLITAEYFEKQGVPAPRWAKFQIRPAVPPGEQDPGWPRHSLGACFSPIISRGERL